MKNIIITVLISTLLMAHGGRTDRYGGHNNRKTGGYHYHNAGSVHAEGNPYQNHTNCGITLPQIKEKKHKVVGWKDPKKAFGELETSKRRVLAQAPEWKGTNQALLDSVILHKAYNVDGYSIYEPTSMKKERLSND